MVDNTGDAKLFYSENRAGNAPNFDKCEKKTRKRKYYFFKLYRFMELVQRKFLMKGWKTPKMTNYGNFLAFSRERVKTDD